MAICMVREEPELVCVPSVWSDLPKLASVSMFQIGRGETEVRMIEQVVCLGAELHRVRLRDPELLDQRSIGLDEARVPENVAARIADLEGIGIEETARPGWGSGKLRLPGGLRCRWCGPSPHSWRKYCQRR